MANIKELLEAYENNILESLMVMSHLLDVDKSYIYAHLDEDVDCRLEDRYRRMMEKLEENYPIQYLLNEKDFMSLGFYLEEGVLIPRNDTEVLVEYLIDYIGNGQLDLLEIGYGSGVISLSLAYYCRNINVTGIDISDKAYKVANINKERLALDNVNFIKGNLFAPLVDESFDVIVSNPPYIRRKDIRKLDKNVREYEPGIALDGGEDGLDFYRKITRGSINFLRNDGLLVYEVGYDQAGSVARILEDCGFRGVKRLKDIQGYERVVVGFKG